MLKDATVHLWRVVDGEIEVVPAILTTEHIRARGGHPVLIVEDGGKKSTRVETPGNTKVVVTSDAKLQKHAKAAGYKAGYRDEAGALLSAELR